METIKTRIATGAVEENEEGKEVKVYEMVEVDYDFGDNLDGFVDLCDEATTLSLAKAQATVSLQGRVRALYKAGTDDIQAEINSWKPGMKVARTSVDPFRV